MKILIFEKRSGVESGTQWHGGAGGGLCTAALATCIRKTPTKAGHYALVKAEISAASEPAGFQIAAPRRQAPEGTAAGVQGRGPAGRGW